MIEVRKFSTVVPVSDEVFVDDLLPPLGEVLQRIEEHRRWLASLPPEAQARVRAEQAAEAERLRAEREAERCPHCGCHPDEHGDY